MLLNWVDFIGAGLQHTVLAASATWRHVGAAAFMAFYTTHCSATVLGSLQFNLEDVNDASTVRSVSSTETVVPCTGKSA